MKIVLATGIFPPDIGGPAIYTERLAEELSRRNFEAAVITYADPISQKADVQNAKFKIQKVSRKYPAGLRHLIYLLKLVKLAKGCDVIYAQNVTSAGLPALLAAKLLRKRLVLKVVGDAAWEQNKGYLRAVQGAVARFADRVIVPSLYLKKRVERWGVAEEKIEVVYNAPDPPSQLNISKEEAKERIGTRGDIILSIGRLVPWKGFAGLIALMPDLLQQNPNFKLVIVGQGQEKLEAGEGVKLVGSVPHSEIPLYFKAADIFVLNSGYEGLSHVILEAMQEGVPVITSAEGGNPELIEDGVNGLLVEYKNRNQIKEAILRLWRDKDLREKFRQNSFAKLKNFSWDNLVAATLRVLKA